MRTLRDSIIDTLAFFAIFDFPLTVTEVFDRLWEPSLEVKPQNVTQELERLVAAKVIVTGGGYFALENIEAARERRRGAHWLVAHKLKRVRRALHWAAWIPFMRAVFICNTVAFGWPRPQSDIDVFVVVRRGRLWLTRLFLTVALGLPGYRRHGTRVADQVCLSFYITDSTLDLSAVRTGEDDVLLTYWSLFLHPLYDPEHIAPAVRASNHWAHNRVPGAPIDGLLHPIVPQYRLGVWFKKELEKKLSNDFGTRLNNWAGTIQKCKMQTNAHSVQHFPDNRVVISNDMLKFHENDRRGLYRDQWNEKRLAARARLPV